MKPYTKKISYALLGFTATLSLGFLSLPNCFTANAEGQKDALITPTSYEQYLKLTSPSDVAVNERYTAISDKNNIYLYDRVEGVYRKYEHNQNVDQSKNDVTKLEFSDNGALYFSDKSTSLYRLNPATLTAQKEDLVCSTFTLSGMDLYFSNVSGGFSSISKAELSNLSLSSSTAIVDGLLSDTVLAISNDEIFYTDSGKYLYKYSNAQSSFISNFSNSLTSISVTSSLFCCTDNSGVFSVYDLIDLYANQEKAEPLFTAEGNFSKLTIFDDFVYAIDGDSVKQYSLLASSFTGYQICATSNSQNRLNGATDVLLHGDKVITADAGNSRISVREKNGNYTVIPTDIDSALEQKLCATENTVLVWTSEKAYLYDLTSSEQLATFSFGESTLTGAVGVYGRYYFVTANNGYYYASLEQTSAEKIEWTLSAPVVKSGSHPTMLASDIYGNLYVAKSGSLYKYTEIEFLDATIDNSPLFALPANVEKLGLDYDCNIYVLTDDTLTKYVASTAWSTVEFSLKKSAVYSETPSKVTSFTFGVEENATYILYDNSYILSTPDLALPTVNALTTENSHADIFSKQSAQVSIVQTKPKSVLIEFDFESFKADSPHFPYLTLTRSELSHTALKLGETSEYNVLAEYDTNIREYRTYLVKKSYCETLPENEFSVTYTQTQYGYASNGVHLYKFPYLHSLMTVGELSKNQKIKLLGEITKLDNDYYLIECETESGKLLGYIPKNFVNSFDGSWPETDKFGLESQPADVDMIWRLAYLIFGLLAICILADYLILRKRPEEPQSFSELTKNNKSLDD